MANRTIEQQHIYHRTEAYREYQRKYKQEQRAWAKEKRRCASCLKQDAYTLNGRYYCAECAAKNRRGKNKGVPFERVQNETKSGMPKIKRSERPSYGLCYFCGSPLADAEVANTVHGEKVRCCERCLERQRKNAERMCRANKARGPRKPLWPTPNAVESYNRLLDMHNREQCPEV